MVADGRPGGIAVLVADDAGEVSPAAAEAAFPNCEGTQSLVVLVLLEAAINAVFGLVLGTDVTACILAVNLDLALEDHVLPAPGNRLAQLH